MKSVRASSVDRTSICEMSSFTIITRIFESHQ